MRTMREPAGSCRTKAGLGLILLCAWAASGASAQTPVQAVGGPLAPVSAQGSPYPILQVQVASSAVRASPSVAAPIVAKVSYKQSLYVSDSASGWTRVLVPGMERWGYIFSSALSARPLGPSLPGSQPKQGVSGTEINLAGKGFSSNPEKDAQAGDGLSFSWVDAMEKYSIDQRSLVIFMQGRREE
ncbi:MAG TPA: hypothetical protein VIO60_08905 [Rectinemataceae bacterium]